MSKAKDIIGNNRRNHYNRFPQTLLKNKDGKEFKLSIQAHDGAYCSPRNNRHESLLAYDEVEVAFLYDDCFVQPSEVKFGLNNADYDSVLPYVKVSDVVSALDKFFKKGGEVVK